MFISISRTPQKSVLLWLLLWTHYNLCLVPASINELKRISNTCSFCTCKKCHDFTFWNKIVLYQFWSLLKLPRSKRPESRLRSAERILTVSAIRTGWGWGTGRQHSENGNKGGTWTGRVALLLLSCDNQPMDPLLRTLWLKHKEQSHKLKPLPVGFFYTHCWRYLCMTEFVLFRELWLARNVWRAVSAEGLPLTFEQWGRSRGLGTNDIQCS